MSEPNEKPESETSSPQVDLANELRELGSQIEQAVRSALASEQARNIQRDISAGMREIGAQMQNALNSIKEDPRVANLAERGQQAISQARENQSIKDFQDSLARGVSQLNEQLSSFVTRLQSQVDPQATNSAQRVPIEHDEPTTGETTRLDPDKKANDDW